MTAVSPPSSLPSSLTPPTPLFLFRKGQASHGYLSYFSMWRDTMTKATHRRVYQDSIPEDKSPWPSWQADMALGQLIHKQEAERAHWEMVWAFEPQSLFPRIYFLQQCLTFNSVDKLGTKYSNIWACGSHSYSHYHCSIIILGRCCRWSERRKTKNWGGVVSTFTDVRGRNELTLR